MFLDSAFPIRDVIENKEQKGQIQRFIEGLTALL